MDKHQILTQAWFLYYTNYPATLGKCIRQSCTQMQSSEHKRLSTLDGEPALCYFNEHYTDGMEQQLTLEDLL
jgi:hypothetical protein